MWSLQDRAGTVSSSASQMLPDGLIALRNVLKVGEVMRLIEKTARWVDAETFRLLPAWYPEHARRSYFYKANWTQKQMNRDRETGLTVHKQEGNLNANKALTHALGLRSDNRPNWSCCHIGGVDDARFQQSNAVVGDRRFYSCVGNMVLLPTPLKAFTDTMPEVKAMLRVCAGAFYGWWCEHDTLKEAVATIEAWSDWTDYPATWPRRRGDAAPPGVMKINNRIRTDARRRLAAIRRDLVHAGEFYPRVEVRAVLDFWKVDLAEDEHEPQEKA